MGSFYEVWDMGGIKRQQKYKYTHTKLRFAMKTLYLMLDERAERKTLINLLANNTCACEHTLEHEDQADQNS